MDDLELLHKNDNELTPSELEIKKYILAQQSRINTLENGNALKERKINTLENENASKERKISNLENENIAKERKINTLENENASKKKEFDILKAKSLSKERKINTLEKKILKQINKIDKLEQKTNEQQLLIEQLLKLIEKKEFQRLSQVLRSYNIKSEKADVIVNEAEVINETSSEEAKKEAEIIEEEIKEKNKDDKPKVKRGRKKGTSNFDHYDLDKIQTTYIDIDEEEDCPICGEKMIIDGEETITKLILHPAYVERIVYRIKKRTCKNCGEKSEANNIDIFNNNIATPSLVANIITNKFAYALPYYRQEDIYSFLGASLSRISLSKYALLAADYLKPLYELMIQDLLNTSCKVIQADETEFKCIMDCKKAERDKNYVYVYSTTYYDKRIRIYSYCETRSGSNPKEMLKNFSGYLECDGYDGYNNIPNVTLARCWVHARRKFTDIVKTLKENQKKNSIAFKIVKIINELFKIEKEAKDLKLTPIEILEYRKKKSLPIVDKYFSYLKEIKDTIADPLLEAVEYSLNLENELRTFLLDGHIPLDNNLSERTVKPFVIMRKNALFAYSNEGAKGSCILMSIVQTAKENLLDVEKYLTYVFEQLNVITTSKLRSLLPYSPDLPKDLHVNIK